MKRSWKSKKKKFKWGRKTNEETLIGICPMFAHKRKKKKYTL